MMRKRITGVTSALVAAIGTVAALGVITTGSTAAIASASAVPSAHVPAGPSAISESMASAGKGKVMARVAWHKYGKDAMRLRPFRVSLASLSPTLRADFTRHGRAPATVTAYEIVSLLPPSGSFCLDANDVGSTAGMNGDKVQVWSCTGGANQLWIPLQWEQGGGALTELVNDQYQTKCLNANSYPYGLQNGSNTQLYSCGPQYAGQDLWNFGNWESYVQSGFWAYLFLNTTNFVLAATTPVADGNVVEIGIPLNTGVAWTAQLWS